MTVVEIVARNARMYPDEIALIQRDTVTKARRALTWKEFNDRVNKVANALIDRGIKKGDKVNQIMHNSVTVLEIQLGIMKTGAWIAPLSFRFDSREIKYCADVAEAKIMILGEEFLDRVEAVRPELHTIRDYIFVGENPPKGMEAFEDVMSKASSEPVEVELNDDDGASLYFTSGTTGTPKPILLTHKNLEHIGISMNHNWNIKHEDKFLLLQPLYHAGGGMMWFGCLIVGAPAVLMKGVVRPQAIIDAVKEERVTILFLVVPWAQDILLLLDRGEVKLEDYDLRCCRLLAMGGQPVPPSLIKHWKTCFPHMAYDALYGLAEASGPGCVHLTTGDPAKWGAIGKASFNWETRIVTDKGEDVPQGEVGELIVKGNSVMKGYYKNPEKTAETIKGGRLYTGDMAKTDSDGFIYLVDRRKDVIIYGGENVYPVEIEDLLRSHPKIYDAGVIGIPDVRLGEVVAAVIDPKLGVTLTEEEVNIFCEQNLPRYKRPKRIIFDKVPRNPTGKIEKPKMRQKYAGIKESFRI